MSTPHEVARAVRQQLTEDLEKAYQAETSAIGGTAYAYGYLRCAVMQAVAALDRLQAGSGDSMARKGGAHAPLRASNPAAGEEAICFGDALCWNERCPTHGAVSDAEAEAVADSLVGQPVDSHVPRAYGKCVSCGRLGEGSCMCGTFAGRRAYVGPGPARLAARFPIHKRGGR